MRSTTRAETGSAGVAFEADLHTHSHHSDGVDSPAEIVSQAVAVGLRAVALTDHDSVMGIAQARAAAPRGFEVIAGVELSSTYHGRDIHLLAYDIDPVDEELDRFLAPIEEGRRDRAERIVRRLNTLGVGVSMDDVLRIARGTEPEHPHVIGRPHIAEAIVRAGSASSIDDAFAKYLRRGRPAHVAKACVTVEEALMLARARGASLVAAHPALDLSDELIEALAGEGIDGIEVLHPQHDSSQRHRLQQIADRHGLVATGGSDYHGFPRKRYRLGESGVSMAAIRELRARAANRRTHTR